VGHDTVVWAGTYVAPNAAVSGRCVLGARVRVGAGATGIDHVRIGDDVTLGAGAGAVRDLLETGTYVGVPARRLAPPGCRTRGC